MARWGKWGNCRVGAGILGRVVEMRRGRVGSWTTKSLNSGRRVRVVGVGSGVVSVALLWAWPLLYGPQSNKCLL